MDIRVERAPHTSPLPPADELAFGRVFSDHMFRAAYDGERGWHGASIAPRAPIALDPAASVLQYGQSVFEGLKAFRTVGGAVALFRPELHARRLGDSARRICLPEVPVGDFL